MKFAEREGLILVICTVIKKSLSQLATLNNIRLNN